MSFTAHDLRYKAEETYPVLYAYLSRHAQRFLRSLKFDPVELDLVVGHVVEMLVRIGLLGGGDKTPLTALDHMSTAQFYSFLNHSIRNKAIDRLRKRRLQVNSTSELRSWDNEEGEDDILDDVTEPIWGPPPFNTPENIALELASQEELRNLLKDCIKELSAAPRQLQALILELQEFGADELLRDVIEQLRTDHSLPVIETSIAHVSQHKDHAHKKLRHCLQGSSANLTVLVALRLTEYGVHSANSKEYTVDIQTLAQQDLTEREVRIALNELVARGLVGWSGGTVVHITSTQMKGLTRFYQEE